jgi:gag-polypeptide of LTR copia-type
VVKFSGKRQDWIAWQVQHLARSTRKGYREVIDGKEKIPTKSEEASLDPKNDADKIKIVAKNKEAYSDLILSMMYRTPHGNVAFNIVRQAVSADYPNGNAADAFARLKKRYQPDTAPELTRIHKLFYGTRQKKNQDPDLYINYLEDLRFRMAEMQSSMTDDQFLRHVLNGLDKEYEHQVNLIERRVDASSNPLTIEEMRDELCLRFERLSHKTVDGDLGQEEEQALYTGHQLKGKCYYCGKIGHKGANCRDNNKNQGNGGRGARRGPNNYRTPNQGNRLNGNCNYCHKYGHKAGDCR